MVSKTTFRTDENRRQLVADLEGMGNLYGFLSNFGSFPAPFVNEIVGIVLDIW